ncbi:MAG: T9SS type A sorting domain-containing protein [Candidatus Kapabacteria bacterium]|nr:T9SS type A sorting domain-containing protein [Candidatus Kapabacteria bacterium]
MKRVLLLVVIAYLLASAFANAEPDPRFLRSSDFAVLINVEIDEQAPSITLKWKHNELAKSYFIFKKLVKDNFWSANPIATLDSNITEFTDNAVQIGVEYEYEVRMLFLVSIGSNDDSQVGQMMGFGYACAGVNIAAKHDHGTVLLVVDETMATPLESEIERLKDDLRGEGWGVDMITVARAEAFNGAAVIATKNQILAAYTANPAINTVYLLGRIAVPYSGDLAPDAHANHRGAWPADIYYGYISGHQWFTDASVNVVVEGQREANKNVPGDGKFDITEMAIPAELAVGRVDLYDMPQFHNEDNGLTNETELLRNYLNKNHLYRTGQQLLEKKGIIDDNFGANPGIETSFSSSGWRNMASLLGNENVQAADWFTTLSTSSALWAYGCGGGSYTSAGGIGNSEKFSNTPVNSVFTMLFGSYFGDWDNKNNLLRAPLASNPSALTCSWSGRPHWYYHHMGTNHSIGYSALLSHNNKNLYKPSIVWTSQYPNGVIYAIGMKQIHTALMGDPTLTMYSNEVPKVPNLSVVVDENEKQVITWDAPNKSGNLRYEIYRSTSEYGIFQKINTTPVSELTYTDNFDYDGKVYYSVRASSIINNNSGSFWALSLHNVTSVTLVSTSVEDELADNVDLKIYPNPVSELLNIKFSTQKLCDVKIEVTDLYGSSLITLLDKRLSSGTHSISWDIKNKSNQVLPQGVYFVKIIKSGQVYIEKINVIR